MYGFIYVLSNQSMPGLLKIGKSERHPKTRADELSSDTGIPEPFQLEFFVEVADTCAAEGVVHEARRHHRVSGDREFFRIDLGSAKKILIAEAGQWIENNVISRSEIDEGQEEDPAGFIYILSNPSMPGLLKIGGSAEHPATLTESWSNDPKIPMMFYLEFCLEVSSTVEAEIAVHSALNFWRIRQDRDFFVLEVSRAKEIVTANAVRWLKDTKEESPSIPEEVTAGVILPRRWR